MMVFIGGSCVFYLLNLLTWLVGAVVRSLWPESAAGARIERVGAGGLLGAGPVCGPIMGYVVGRAVMLLHGADGWSLAPQYGIMLGVAGEIVLGAFRRALLEDAVNPRPDEKTTNPV
jgi:hypothetical protein